MTTLKAEIRNPKIKAKKLRREGFAIGVLFGKNMKESTPLQFSGRDALSFIKNNKAGAQVILEIGDKKISTVVKSIDYDPTKKQILALDCQALVTGEKISTTVQINFSNEDTVQGIVEPALTEIQYKADPANLLDTIEIDFEKLDSNVRMMYVKDLSLGEQKSIEFITPEDALIFRIADHAKNDAIPENTDADAASGTETEAAAE